MHVMMSLPRILTCIQILIRLIGADESVYSNYADAMQWLEETNVLEMIVDKFSSSVRVDFSMSYFLSFFLFCLIQSNLCLVRTSFVGFVMNS